jgi:hypothetical protein
MSEPERGEQRTRMASSRAIVKERAILAVAHSFTIALLAVVCC